MFYYLNGNLAYKDLTSCVIDCGGVGYACRTTNTTIASLKTGDKGKLFTHLNVREDAMELYGFAKQEELVLRCTDPFARQLARQYAQQEDVASYLQNPLPLLAALLECEIPYCSPGGKSTLLPFPMAELNRRFQN